MYYIFNIYPLAPVVNMFLYGMIIYCLTYLPPLKGEVAKPKVLTEGF